MTTTTSLAFSRLVPLCAALLLAACAAESDPGDATPADTNTEATPPVLLPVEGNVDPGTINSFTRVSFVLKDSEYTYFRVQGGDTFVSAVTSKLAVGRFVN